VSVQADVMRIAVKDRGPELRERLRGRLERAAQLRCPTHDQSVFAVTIHARENGWFDSTWITCCADLERQATAIVKDRY
jgi:ribose 1,5-bisphosphokinase PhnN